MDIEALLMDIEAKVGIKTSSRGIERILAALRTTNNYWSVIRMSRETVPVVAHVLKYMRERGYLDDNLNLTAEGIRVLDAMNIEQGGNYTCPKCEGRGIDVQEWKDILKEFERLAAKRPSAIQEYDQGYVTPATTIARLMFADMNNDLRGREIFIIGDDDLVSVAAMLTQYPKAIAVLEIDQRITSFIKSCADERGTDVEIYTMDLREPLPEGLVGRFDTFFTDPPETIEALRLFIGRGIASLKGAHCAGYFGITNAESSILKRFEFQKYLTAMGVMITDLIANFNLYVNWDYYENTPAYKIAPASYGPSEIWYMSNFYRIETIPGYVSSNEMVEGDIYIDNEATTR